MNFSVPSHEPLNEDPAGALWVGESKEQVPSASQKLTTLQTAPHSAIHISPIDSVWHKPLSVMHHSFRRNLILVNEVKN